MRLTLRPVVLGIGLGLFPGLACTSAPPAPAPPPPGISPSALADLVLLSGNVLTLDAETSTGSAIALKQGRVVFVGDDAGALLWIDSSTRLIDLKGRTVVPGLADSHVHLTSLGVRRFGIDLVGTKSIEEI